MKDFVSDRRLAAGGAISAALLLLAVAASPGAPWMGYMSIGIALLVGTTTVMCLGRLTPAASLAKVIHDVDAAGAPRLPSARKERGIR